MKTFYFLRKDYYKVRVEARNIKHAEELINTEDCFLNDGEFLESTFEFAEEEE